jgi:hypothetical protein
MPQNIENMKLDWQLYNLFSMIGIVYDLKIYYFVWSWGCDNSFWENLESQ